MAAPCMHLYAWYAYVSFRHVEVIAVLEAAGALTDARAALHLGEELRSVQMHTGPTT